MDARVVAGVTRWRQRFEGGGVSIPGLRKPLLEPAERWSARALSVGITRRDPQVGVAAWPARPGSTGLMARRDGAAYATDRRILVANGPAVVREWRFEDLYDVRVIGTWLGIMLVPERGATDVDAIATEWSRWVIGSAPNLRRVATTWLTIEATFAWYRGALDIWMEGLPVRLVAARAGARG